MKNNKITNRPLVLISVMLAMFVGAVEATIVTTAMPSIASDLGGFSRYSWIFSSYLLMSTVTVLIYGKLADLFGSKPILFIGLTIFLIGSILCGFAVSMEQLIVFQIDSRSWCRCRYADCDNNCWRYLYNGRTRKNSRVFIECVGNFGCIGSCYWRVDCSIYELEICFLGECATWNTCDGRYLSVSS